MRGLILFLLMAGLLSGLGLFLFYSQKSVEAEVIAAIERDDIDALAARIDFDGLRDFLKQDLRTKKNDQSPAGKLYADAGPELHKIDEVVDYYVRPENIAILYYMRKSAAEGIPVDAFIVGRGYAPIYGFSLTFGPPEALLHDSPARTLAERFKVRARFHLDGLTWKIAALDVPLFMVPKFTYSRPAVDIYAPRRG